MDLSRWARSIEPFKNWIAEQDMGSAKEWERRINANDDPTVEGAAAEAVAWDYLAHRTDSIARRGPRGANTRNPDFFCRTDGVEFAVEVTNLSREVVTEATHLQDPYPLNAGFRSYGDWVHLVKRELSAKAAQGAGLSVPYVVFVTTLHIEASVMLCSKSHVESLLHSPAMITIPFDSNLDPAGDIYQSTDFRLAAFTRAGTAAPGRRNVSCLLVGGFGTYPDVRVLGIEHPDAVRPLRRGSIAELPLCYFKVWPPDPRIVIDWTDEPAT